MTVRAVFLAILALVGCSKVQVPNTEFCADMGALGAACFYSDSDQERELEKDAWDQERFGMLCTTGESYGEWKAAILKLCSETNLCKRAETEKVVAKLDNIQERAKQAKLRGRRR